MRYTPVPSIARPSFLRLRDLRDLDFARGKLSYRGGGAGGYVKF